MKLAIISDCHFGFNEDAAPQAREALLKALQMHADAIILPGDLFDARVPKQETLHESIQLLSEIKKASEGSSSAIKLAEITGEEETRMENAGMPMLAIWGTHERRSKGLANAIHILDAAGLVVSLHTRKIVLQKGSEKVVVQALGGVPEEYFRRTLELGDFKPLRNAYNIFVFHQNLQELLPVERDEDVSMDELPAGFDLYINGHIHWNHDLKINGRRLLVAGSTVVTQMKRNEEKGKGFYLFDTETQKAEFVKIQGRPFFFREIEVRDADANAIEEALEKELRSIMKEAHLKKPLIKIKISGSVKGGAVASLNLDKIIRKYSENSLVFVDKDFGNEALKEKIETIRKLRKEGKGARELGIEILKEKIRHKNLGIRNPQELFELLAEGETEEAIRQV
ncbi:MAG: metallophosphoesterase [Candidatus Micrarchaeota archaeon]